MSLSTNILDFATRVATEIKSVRSTIGSLAGLSTTDKTTIVGAVNEVRALVVASKTVIDDAVASTSTVWSSSRTDSAITTATQAVRNDILGGAGAAYDTLQELRDLLATVDTDADSAIAAINTALGNRVRFDEAQTLTALQMLTARTNIDAVSATDVGSTSTDYVAAFEAALV